MFWTDKARFATFSLEISIKPKHEHEIDFLHESEHLPAAPVVEIGT